MLSTEDKLGLGLFAVGWVLFVLGAPLIVVPMLFLLGIPASGLGLAAILTGLLVVRRDAQHVAAPGPFAAILGVGLIFLAVLTLAIAAFDTLQLTGPLVLNQQRGLTVTLSPNNGLRLLAEAFCLAALTTGGLMLKARWPALHATAAGLFSACTIPAIAAALVTFSNLGMPLTT